MARTKALNYKRLLLSNIDPIEHFNTKQKTLVTLSVTSNEYLDMEKTKVSKRTLKLKRSRLEAVILKHLGDTLIRDIQHQQLSKLLANKAKSWPEVATKTLGYLKAIWLYAISKGYCEKNIVLNIYKPSIIPTTKTTHYSKITEPKLLKELILAINTYKGHKSIRNAMRFLLHLPLRAGVLIKLKWSYIDFSTRALIVPREEMKVKDKNLGDYRVPLTNELIHILLDQYQTNTDSIYIFSRGDKYITNEGINKALRSLGFVNKKKQTAHSFRGTFRSLVETHQLEHKLPLRIAEVILDHTNPNKVEVAYSHKADYFLQIKKLLAWWERYLKNLRKTT